MKSRVVIAVAALLMLAGAARADEVVLKNGRKIVGIYREEGNKIVVELPFGTVAFKKEDVVSVTPGRTLLHEYNEKAEAIKDSKNVKDYVGLALWAKAGGLTRYVRPNFEKALALDPDNEMARRGLGFTLQNGRWMTEDEVRRSQGFVKLDGRWVTQLEMELINRRKLEAEAARLAAEEERRLRKEAREATRKKAIQDYYDRMDRMRRQREDVYPRGYDMPYYGYGQEILLTYDVFGLLNGLGFRYQLPIFSPMMPVPMAPAPPIVPAYP